MPSVSHLTIRGFKSISAMERFELGSLNILIGANGAGKSNLLDVFRMLAAMPGRRFQIFVAQQDGPEGLLFQGSKNTEEIEIECAFGSAAYSASFSAVGRHLVFTRETTAGTWLGSGHYESNLAAPELTEGNPYVRALRDAMSEWTVYQFHDTATNSPIRQAQPVRDNLRLHPSGGNIAPFLRHIREKHPDNYRRIVESVRLAAPYFDDFLYREDPGERVDLEWSERDIDHKEPLTQRQLSDGTLRFVCLSTLLNQPIHLQPDPILIDEPELGLHPYALALVAEMIKAASSARQVLVSTQSSDLVSEFEPEDIVTVSRRNGESVFERLEAEPLKDWLEEYALGELWRMNVVGRSPSR